MAINEQILSSVLKVANQGVIVDMRVTNSLQQMDFVLPTPPSFSDLANTIKLVGESAISRGENIKRQEYVDHLGKDKFDSNIYKLVPFIIGNMGGFNGAADSLIADLVLKDAYYDSLSGDLSLADKSKACASLRRDIIMAVQRAQADAICDRGIRTGMCCRV